MEKIILEVLKKNSFDNAVTSHSQCGFMRAKSCFLNLISFYDKVNHLVNQEKPVGANYLFGFQ